jgi:DNA repair exonuclease SbcCD ATPase subunit/DNA repair exonuclease SbcCD nuclease subunit
MTKIAHISDIHWRSFQRHQEYTEAFNLLFKNLLKENVDLIICTGDIFHTKTQNISPEVVDKIVWMFQRLISIAPTHTILGNHDGNLANEDRYDIISPIVDAIANPRLKLYKNSGTYQVDGTNIHLGVFSCFDKPGWNKVVPVQNNSDAINIALFHGSVSGCQTDGLWRLREAEVNLSHFSGWHFAMLGDIHKQQFLDKRFCSGPVRGTQPWIGYPGSLIQQNYGEDLQKGYYIWDIKSKNEWSVQFCELTNLAPFVSIKWMGNVSDTIKEAEKTAPLKNARVRLISSEVVSRLDYKLLQQYFQKHYNIIELVTKIDAATKTDSLTTKSTGEVKKTSLRNDPETLSKLFREFVAGNDKLKLLPSEVEAGVELLSSYVNRLAKTDYADYVRDVVWSLKGIEFDNLYRYGEGNRIDFEKLSGIVGVFAPNRMGKSSIVGSLMFGLFNTTDRGPVKNAYIINKSKTTGVCKVMVNVNGKDYYIVRKAEKAMMKRNGFVDEEKATTSLNLFRFDATSGALVEETVSENGETRSDTDKVIRNLLGNSNDFLLTAFANQGGINKFIEEGATERKAILNRFLDLDVFDTLFKMANDERNILDVKLGRHDPGLWLLQTNHLKKRLEDKKKELETVEAGIKYVSENLEQLKEWFSSHNNFTGEQLLREIKTLDQELKELEQTQKKRVVLQKKLERQITADTELVAKLADELAEIDPEILVKKKETLNDLQKLLSVAKTTYTSENHKLETQRKNVRKLNLVPCGDSYPECHYIKDAHSDKKLIEEQQKLVAEALSKLSDFEREFSILSAESIEKKLTEYERKHHNKEHKEKLLNLSKQELITVTESLESTEKAIKQNKKLLKTAKDKLAAIDSAEFVEKQKQKKAFQEQLDKLDKTKNNLYMDIGSDRTKLQNMEKEKQEVDEINKQFKIADAVAHSLSKVGIPAIVLKTQLPVINLELQKLLTGIVDFKVFLETGVNSNSLEVYIEDNSSRRVIELGSGMEKMISSLAIRVALINLSSLPKSDTFIIDEGFGVLDEEGIEKCMQLLTLLKEYFKTILVISHIPQIKEIAERVIEIKNLGSESQVIV